MVAGSLQGPELNVFQTRPVKAIEFRIDSGCAIGAWTVTMPSGLNPMLSVFDPHELWAPSGFDPEPTVRQIRATLES
jgi:hypothetical protein